MKGTRVFGPVGRELREKIYENYFISPRGFIKSYYEKKIKN